MSIECVENCPPSSISAEYSHQYRRDPPGGVGEVLDLLRPERAGEDVALPVGEPLLEDLVAAELVAPDGSGDVAPPGAAVQADAEGGLAEDGDGVLEGGAFARSVRALDASALAGHDRIALSEVPPAGGEREVGAFGKRRKRVVELQVQIGDDLNSHRPGLLIGFAATATARITPWRTCT